MCPICYWGRAEKSLQKEWRGWVKMEMTPSCGCTWWWKYSVQHCKEQYHTETWNVRSMNQGKLDVVKQEMARVNGGILGISELKWTWIGMFKSDDHYIYYWGQEFLRRNGVALRVNKSWKCNTWLQSQKWQNGLSSLPRQTIQNHSNTSLCHNHQHQRSWSWTVLWRFTRHFRTNTEKKMSFLS